MKPTLTKEQAAKLRQQVIIGYMRLGPDRSLHKEIISAAQLELTLKDIERLTKP